jgi:hypothetical protein
LPPYEPQQPTNRPPNRLVPGNRSSDADPPPSLPFGVPAMNASAPVLPSPQGPTIQMPQGATAGGKQSNDDPPPSLPVALATYVN